MNLIFKKQNEKCRAIGYGENVTSVSDSTLYETTEDELSEVFEKAGAEDLEGTGEPIEAAVEDPLRFRDFLVLEDGEIAFDEEYVRETVEEDDAE